MHMKQKQGSNCRDAFLVTSVGRLRLTSRNRMGFLVLYIGASGSPTRLHIVSRGLQSGDYLPLATARTAACKNLSPKLLVSEASLLLFPRWRRLSSELRLTCLGRPLSTCLLFGATHVEGSRLAIGQILNMCLCLVPRAIGSRKTVAKFPFQRETSDSCNHARTSQNKTECNPRKLKECYIFCWWAIWLANPTQAKLKRIHAPHKLCWGNVDLGCIIMRCHKSNASPLNPLFINWGSHPGSTLPEENLVPVWAWVKSPNIPIPTKIGPNMGGEFTYPKTESQTVLTTTAISLGAPGCFTNSWRHASTVSTKVSKSTRSSFGNLSARHSNQAT